MTPEMICEVKVVMGPEFKDPYQRLPKVMLQVAQIAQYLRQNVWGKRD